MEEEEKVWWVIVGGILLLFIVPAEYLLLGVIALVIGYVFINYSQQQKSIAIKYTQSTDTKAICLGDNQYVDIKYLSSMGVSGMPGSGKSTYVTYLLNQVAKEYPEIPIVILDVHYPDVESLGSRVLAEGISAKVHSDIADIRNVLAEREGEYLIVIDEFTGLLRRDKKLKEDILYFVQEGRKFKQYIWLMAQDWKASNTGGTEIRDSLVSFSVLRQRKATSRIATGISDIPDTSLMKHGQVYSIVYGKGIDEMLSY